MTHNFNWFSIRWAALTLVSAILIDIEFILLNVGFVFFHINMGLQTIIKDYIHVERINLVSSSIVKISYIELVRYFLELFI
uniref:Succinate:cytochrome c oxidoreductase subunit 4 n=1 Tax=Gelidiella flabella TaxID=2026927 RepID=A0A7G9IW84_9FLOR|nr:succinate:cytochrome c oxidoreductase subunit 4 [Gelidiella flabella]QNM39628.1 succinate:cytochrome c oxidoreductase subunit 4 [Gelidiella flabella]